MSKPTLDKVKLAEQVTSDLMRKIEDDVTAVIRRVIGIAPPPYLPIITSAGAVCIGFAASELEHMSADGRVAGSEPDPDCVLLAGLLIAHMGIGGPDPIHAAYQDMKAIKTARSKP